MNDNGPLVGWVFQASLYCADHLPHVGTNPACPVGGDGCEDSLCCPTPLYEYDAYDIEMTPDGRLADCDLCLMLRHEQDEYEKLVDLIAAKRGPGFAGYANKPLVHVLNSPGQADLLNALLLYRRSQGVAR